MTDTDLTLAEALARRATAAKKEAHIMILVISFIVNSKQKLSVELLNTAALFSP